MKIAVSCGGTGGHVFPGLALARTLKSRSHDITLWLAGKNIEAASTSTWDGPVVTIQAEGLSSHSRFRSLLALCRLACAAIACIAKMKKDRPEVLVAMGSYAAVGPVLAARFLGVPVVLHEANVVPGRAVRFLSRFATAIAVSFEQTLTSFSDKNCVVTGFPVRADLASPSAESLLPDEAFTILVTGGSQGAHALNEVASEAICVSASQRGMSLQVVHLTGPADEQDVRTKYEQAGICAAVFPFLADMGRAYAAADLAICRAGGSTCAELTAVGLPALLIPYPAAVNDHQSANAKVLQATGQADVITQQEMTAEWLADYIVNAHADSEKLKRMKDSAANRQVNAADKLADLVESIAE